MTPLPAGWITAILPELILSVAGMLLILFDVFVPRARAVIPALAVIDLLIAFWSEMAVEGGTYFAGTYQISNITRVFDIVFLLAAISPRSSPPTTWSARACRAASSMRC